MHFYGSNIGSPGAEPSWTLGPSFVRNLFVRISLVYYISFLSLFLWVTVLYRLSYISRVVTPQTTDRPGISFINHLRCTRGYQKVLSLTWKEPEIWIYSALFFNVVPFQLHTLVPSSFPVINTRSVEVNILVP